jgi:hypothetical protein
VVAGISLVPAQAHACGGFFCNNVTPVVQTAERILFRINDDGTMTTVVEVQYEGPPGNFGWIVPIPHVIDPEEVMTVEPGFFDTLEVLTAPVFETPPPEGGDEGGTGGAAGGGYADMSDAGCGMGGGGRRGGWGGGGSDHYDEGWDDPPPPPDTSGVEVVGEAVVGPYAVEVITAEQGENLSNWLLLNGYQIPQTAAMPMQHYIDQGAAFVGLKLQADVPAGPIDALAFTTEGVTPSVPLILTSVACASELEIVAYVAGQGRYEPGNYVDLDFDYSRVGWVGAEDTNYESWLRGDVETAGGRAWNTEFARPLSQYPDLHHAGLNELLPRELYLTRFHTFIQPERMTEDPWWRPSSLPDVDNRHIIWDYPSGGDPDDGGEDDGGEDDGEESDGRLPFSPDVGMGLLLPIVVWGRRRRR